MRLSVSNIAWPATADDAAAEVLRAYGAGGVEIAPARVCERPWEASAATVAASRAAWEDRGLTIVALQALLFGRACTRTSGNSRLSRAERWGKRL
jgi:sugar phosphate isomerase/epimerase